MAVYETDLPGVGKKFEVDLDDDAQLVVVIHNTGKRELFLRDSPEEDSEKLFQLSDRLARQVGTIMEGAYFQPIETGTIETVLDEDSLIEWVAVDEGSELVGRSLDESDLRQETGVSIVAIQRDDETIANPGPGMVVEAGDTLVALGSRDSHQLLQSVVAGSEDGDDEVA